MPIGGAGELEKHMIQPLRGWSKRDRLITGSTNNIQLQANFGYIGYYTVQFAQSIPPGALSEAGDIQTIADIIWTVKGNQVTRRVSVGNGTTISGMGEFCTVNISDLSGVGNSTAYEVGCLIAPGSRPTSGTPPFIGYNTLAATPSRGVTPAVTITAGNTQTFFVPLNVGVNSVYLAAGPGDRVANAQPDFEDFASAAVSGSTLLAILRGNAFNRWVPIPPTATTLQVLLGAGYPNAGGIIVTPYWGVEG